MTKRDGRHCTPPNLQRWPSFNLKGRINGIEHSRVGERLVQEFHGSLFERLLPDALLFLTGDEDDGNHLPTTFQFLLKVKSVHSWHRDVQDQTTGRIHIIRREKLSRRRKSSSVKAEHPEQVR